MSVCSVEMSTIPTHDSSLKLSCFVVFELRCSLSLVSFHLLAHFHQMFSEIFYQVLSPTLTELRMWKALLLCCVDVPEDGIREVELRELERDCGSVDFNQ